MHMSVPNRRGSLPQQVMHERRVIDDCRVCEASTSSQERCIRFDCDMLREKKKHEEGLPSEARSKRHTSSAEAVGKAVSPNKTVAANDERARSCEAACALPSDGVGEPWRR